METTIRHLGGMVTKFVIILLCGIFYVQSSLALTSLPDVKVNTNDYYDIKLDDCGNNVSVLKDSVYLIWQAQPEIKTTNVYFSKSENKGITFSQEKRLFEFSDTMYHWYPSIAVSKSGVVHVVANAVSNNEVDYNIVYTKSIDGGKNFTAIKKITDNNISAYPAIGSYGENVYIFYAKVSDYPKVDYYFVRSADNGISFSNPVKINDAPCLSDSVEFDGITSLFVDYNGKIYLAWVDGRRANGKGDIFLTKSVDNGVTFSPNVMVNDVSQDGADSVQFKPLVVADWWGNVYVCFSDKRFGLPSINRKAYLSRSFNGGETFFTEKLLGNNYTVTRNFNVAVNNQGVVYAGKIMDHLPFWGVNISASGDRGDSFSQGIFFSTISFASYHDFKMVIGDDDEVYGIWVDTREGLEKYNLYFTRTNSETSIDEHADKGDVVVCSDGINGQYFLKLPERSEVVKITVFDLKGNVVFRKSDKRTSFVKLDMNAPSGFYFVHVVYDNKTKTVKLIYN